MIEERSMGVQDPGESNIERLCRGIGGEGRGWRNTPLSAIF